MDQLAQSIEDEYASSFPSERQMVTIMEEKYPELHKSIIEKYVKDHYGWSGDIYRRPMKVKRYSKFRETIVDKQHQIDLVEMPVESKHRWRYIMSYIDVASRKGTARAIGTKTPLSVRRGLSNIYESGEMRKPMTLQSDCGNEFRIDDYLKSMGIEHVTTLEKNHQAIVERFNQTITKPLFRYMDAKEQDKFESDPSKYKNYRYNAWGDILRNVIDAYNDRVHSTIKMKPNDAYMKKVLPRDEDLDEDLESSYEDSSRPELPVGTLVRIVIDRPNTVKVRATDPMWSKEVYVVASSSRKSDKDPVKYKLLDNMLGFVNGRYYREELLVVTDTSELGGYTMNSYAKL